MLTRLRAVRMGHRRDAGVTLVELMVGMSLVAIIGAVALKFFVTSATQTNRVAAQTLDGSDARVTAERIAGVLRLADTPTACPGISLARFLVASSTQVVFFANLDPTSRVGTAGRTPPVKVDIRMTTDAQGRPQLVESLYRPTTKYTDNYPNPYAYASNYPTTATSTRVLIGGASAPSMSLTYQRGTPGTGGFPARCSTTTTGGENIAAVAIDLTVGTGRGSTRQNLRTTAAITGALS